MGLFGKIFRKGKPHEEEISQSPRACKKCTIIMPPIFEKITDEGDNYCAECTKIADPIKWYCTDSDEFEVFVYSAPWNLSIRAYAPRGLAWLPTYQADTGNYKLDRHTTKEKIPSDAIFSKITIAKSEHGNLTRYKDRPALIAIHEKYRLLCAYVPAAFS